MAQEQIPLEKDDTQFLRIYQGSIGNLAYISTVPITVSMDFMILGRCEYSCPEADYKPFIEVLFPTSTYTYEYTKDMRCPDTSYYIQKFLEVSACYENRADRESMQRAFSQLKYLDDQFEEGPTCIQHRDAQVIKSIRKRVGDKLSSTLYGGGLAEQVPSP